VTDPTQTLLSPGTMLAHYRIGLPVGEGAMGTVYEAHDTGLDRRVAVKVLKPEIADAEDTVKRFEREARAAAKVNHPNLTHIYFVGREDGKHYFAMEFLPGRTLEQEIAEAGRMDLPRAVETLVQAARGLAAAHAADVIHRDVKPSNIQILPDGTVKVTDFGLAKSLSGEIDVTEAGRVVGTPRFMSPEQLRGEDLDWRTDLYSLGLLGWFLLTGKVPFAGESLGKVIDDQMNRPLPPLAEHRPDLSDAAQKVFDRFCAKRPADRPETMEEAIGLLESLRPRYLDLAPLAARGAALLMDVLVWSILYGAATAVLVLFSGASEKHHAVAKIVALLLSGFVSQIGFEKWFGASLGKLLFNLRVVDVRGERPGWGQVVGRFFIRFPVSIIGVLPFAPVVMIQITLQATTVVAAIVCYLGFNRRTLSDIITRTRVVYRAKEEHREAVEN